MNNSPEHDQNESSSIKDLEVARIIKDCWSVIVAFIESYQRGGMHEVVRDEDAENHDRN